MLILPDRNTPRARFLLPQRPCAWRQPSQRTSLHAVDNVTRFRIRARLNDGHVVWCGWFDDREDFDAFLFAMATGSLQYEPAVWRLPTPWWTPDFGEHLSYDFSTLAFITSSTGSNQTYNKPSDWDDTANTVETLGAGASGGVFFRDNAENGTGGGGGAWNKITNFSFSGASTTARVGAAGAGVTTSATRTAGNAGGDSWFDGTTLGGASVGSKGGSAGAVAATTTGVTGAAGGVGASGVGTSSNNGGRGGTIATPSTGAHSTGGGGAAGPNGAGANGADLSSPTGNTDSAGGNGDAGSGGAGGAKASVGAATGAAGTEWDASHGSGGGGGAAYSPNNVGDGGNYGAGGGANGMASTSTPSGAGSQGIVALTYTPIPSKFGFNMPMMGM